jgi:hypothetical protein
MEPMIQVKVRGPDSKGIELKFAPTISINEVRGEIRSKLLPGQGHFELVMGDRVLEGIETIGGFGSDVVELATAAPKRQGISACMDRRTDMDERFVRDPHDMEDKIKVLREMNLPAAENRVLVVEALRHANYDVEHAAMILRTKIPTSSARHRTYPEVTPADTKVIARLALDCKVSQEKAERHFISCGKDEDRAKKNILASLK